jgi:hypothetical protein
MNTFVAAAVVVVVVVVVVVDNSSLKKNNYINFVLFMNYQQSKWQMTPFN